MKIITDKRDNQGLVNKNFLEFLKKPVEKTIFTQDELDSLKTTLEEQAEKHKALGLSANQLGIKKRVCLINIEAYDYQLFLVNPTIVERSEEMFLFYESCLSLPKTMDTLVPTVRHQKIVVETDNLGTLTFQVDKEKDELKDENNEHRLSLETLQTAIVQHEIDHLDGFTIKDRRYNTTQVNTNKIGRNEKIVMKAPNGDLVEVKFKKANDYFLKGYDIV